MEQNNKNEKQAQQKKDQKTNRRLANRYLYIAIAAVVCVGAILTGILVGSGEDELPSYTPPVADEPDSPTGVTPVDPSTVLPEFASPAIGILGMKHDIDMPVYSKTMDDWRVHCGVDIVTAAGDKVMAAADGVVESVSEDPMYGTTVVISHNGGAKSIYGNLASELAEGIAVGYEIKCGEIIGCVGDTATLELAEEPHLHFQMTIGGKQVDPMDYISEDSASASLGQDTGYEG